ncbi:MAG: proprotein convertase P-domain-containing protein [Chitinophagaceae bacterium]|nr:proprotein convertase P-domain-containing protein [Chitinophagaceae bacterium]
MKKMYFLLLPLILLTSHVALSQCTNPSAFGTATAPTNTTPLTITTCAFAGEYSTINGAVAGSTYLFTATGGTGNYITIRQGTPGGTVLGFGTSPVSVTCTVSGPLYLHYNTNAACGTDGSCHTGTVQCTSCSAVPPPANDLCAGALPINCGQTINSTTVGATLDAVGTCVTALGSAPGVWYTFTGNGVSTTLSLCGSGYDTKIGVFSGTCAGLTCVTGNDDFCGLQSEVTFTTVLGTQYYVLVTGFSTNSGAFTLTRTCAATGPVNDLCTAALPINCGQTINSTTVGATADAVGTCTTTLGTAPGVWYTFTGDGFSTTLSLCGSAYDTKIGVFSGTCAALTCVIGNDDFCSLQSQVTVNTILGTQYYVLVTGFSTNSGAFTLARTCTSPTPCAENFDGVIAPALPTGWSATVGATCAGTARWVTVNTTSFNAPNSAFANDPGCISDEYLDSRVFPIISPTAQLTFRRSNNLENNFDGLVLEISIGGGAFQDIIAAGGTFVTGGYNGTISAAFGSPIAGRQAWTGNSGGFVLTTINLPAAANGQNIVLRFRRATDSSVAGVGAFIDDISIAGSLCGGGCAGIPTAGTISGATTACVGNAVALTLTGHSTTPGVTIQWKSSTTPGGPYTNIPGATSATYNFTAVGGTRYYIATLTCVNGGGSANTPEFTVAVGAPVHTAVSATVTTVCTPGVVAVTGTVSGGVLQGGNILGTSGTIDLDIPDAAPAGVNTTITLPATTITAAADLKVRINARHSWVGDLKFTLTSPCGTTFLFDRPGVPATTFGNSANLGTSNVATPPPAVYTFDLAAATVIPETAPGTGFIPGGSYRPSDAGGAAHNWAGLTFPCAAGGNWTLNVSDNGGGDLGRLIDWQILGPPVYTHTLTGPGTITQNASTGVGNSTGNFTVSNLPVGLHTFTLTSTDAIGCSVSSNVTALIKQTPIITLTPAAPVICNGTIQQITASVVPPTVLSFNQPATTVVPAGSPTTTTGIGGPYPSQVNVAGLPATGVTVKSVKLGNINHTFPSDMDIVLVSPTGQSVILLSDIGGGTDLIGVDYLLDDAAATNLTAAFNPAGTYRPTNIGTGDNWPAPGPLGTPTSTTLSTFAGNPNGNWSLYVVDDAGGDVGFIGNWSIDFNIPSLVTFSPITNLFTDPAATIPYAGQPISVVYARPTTTTLYTATSTVDGCTGTATVNVTVNQLPVITVQPTPATQTICPGFNVTYSVTATGTGITYQWRQGAVNLVNNAQISGATTNTLTITNVNASNSGTYTVVVSGVCPPPVTSNPVVLNVATAPVISTQPANRTVCVGQSAAFTVATVGSVPPPTIYQWQVSTDGGATWNNLTTGGSYTATFTIPAAVIGQHNSRYRVLVTNSCGQTTTSAVAILTVNALPTVTATALSSRICISDTLVPLSGLPVGGSWSGIGVSGFNFVPSSTAVGTYTLTYTYTNAAGCTASAQVIAKVEDCQERVRLLSDDGLILFPNPNNGLFNIRVNSTLYNYLGMKVYNSQGQLLNGSSVNDVMVSPVYTGLVYGRVIPIDLTKLPAGIYFVKFYYDDGVRTSEKTFKVVIPGH